MYLIVVNVLDCFVKSIEEIDETFSLAAGVVDFVLALDACEREGQGFEADGGDFATAHLAKTVSAVVERAQRLDDFVDERLVFASLFEPDHAVEGFRAVFLDVDFVNDRQGVAKLLVYARDELPVERKERVSEQFHLLGRE